MKTFRQYLSESSSAPTLNLEKIYGEFRQAGIHAGNRLSESPLVATRGMAALSTAAHRMESILREHGLLLHQLEEVSRPDPGHIIMEYTLTEVQDERKMMGKLRVNAKLSPVDKGTVQFYAEISTPPQYA